MSRIHEAMQRAVEQADTGSVTVEGSEAVGSAVEDPVSDAFPVELAEARRPRRAAQAPLGAPAATRHKLARSASEQRDTADGTGLLSFERIDARFAGKIVADGDMPPASREQYRRLAATLHHAQADNGMKLIMLTSAVMGEGKTLTSCNLALTLSESYQKNVLLVDADLRRPAVHTVFKLRSASGLSEGLMQAAGSKIPVHQIASRLAVLTAGRATNDPIAGLTSTRMHRLLTEAREHFDWVIVDTPPVTMLPDANLLASMVDGALVVVRAGSTRWDLVQRAVDTIGRERIVGVVLNSVSEADAGSEYSAYYSYAAAQPEASSST
jgi:capsular exopolysaccharide synthesis family protein